MIQWPGTGGNRREIICIGQGGLHSLSASSYYYHYQYDNVCLYLPTEIECSDICLNYVFADINECHSDPCMNGATCEDGVFLYTCSCVDGYIGTHCETGMLCNYLLCALI